MAEEIERLMVRVEANATQFEAQIKKVNKALYGSQHATQQALRKIKTETAAVAPQLFKPIGDSFKREMSGLAAGLAGAFAAKQVIAYADAYTTLQNRLKTTGLAGEELKRVEDNLYETANRNGIAVAATAELYQRASMARDNLGASERQLLELVSGTSAALKLQGTSAGEASGALLQLGQLLGGTNVQAQEYNSLIDQMPVLLQAVANGSDRFGGSINKLTKLVKDGKVSSREFFNAALIGLEKIKEEAADAIPTFASAMQTLNNEIGRYVGQADSSLSATQRMAAGIQTLASNLDTIVPVIVGLIGLVGTAYVLALTKSASAMAVAGFASLRLAAFQTAMTASMTGTTSASVVATGAMRRLNAALAANPIGAVILVVAALTLGLKLLNDQFSEGAVISRKLEAQSDATAKAFTAYEEAAEAAAKATGEAKKEADRLAASKRELYFIALQNAQALAAETAEIANQRAEMAKLAALEATNGRPKEMGEALGQAAFAGGANREADRAAAQAKEAADDYTAALKNAVDLQARIKNGFAPPAPASLDDDPKKPKKPSGPTPEELARQREQLALQMEISRLQALGTEAADTQARAKQRELDVLSLTKQLTDAGVTNAKATAEAHVQAISTAEDAQRGLAILWEANEKAIKTAEDGNRRSNDLLLDRLGYEAELARLRGDPVAIQTKERELWIEERINALLALRPELSRQAARTIAEGERGGLDAAARQGESNDRARSMARDFTDVLASDNWAEAAGRKFREAAFDNLEDLLTNLFSGIAGGNAGGGNSIGAIVGSALKNMIPGFSAGTSSAPGGLSYVHKGEVLTNLKKGTSVIPAHAVRAMGALAGRTQVQPLARAQISPTLKIDLTGANGDQTIRQLAAEAARAAYAQSVATSSQVVPAQQAQRQRYTR